MRPPSRTISMRSVIVILLTTTMRVASGWIAPPRLCPSPGGILGGVATVGATAAVVGAGAAAAVVAIDRINRDADGRRRAAAIHEPPPGSMDDKVVFVTGGSSGLGLETVKRLAAAGATVVLTSRTEAKGKKAVEAANEYLVKKGRLPTRAQVYNLVLDLDDLSDVMLIASRYEALGLDRDISVLINNAGVMAIPNRELTVDGNERTFQSNHLGHFVLTSVLFPHLSRDGARVVTVSSSASYFAGPRGLDVGNLNGEKTYGAWPSYSSSKLANVLFTMELQRRASDAGLDWLTATTLHPGVVDTDLWRYVVGEERLAKMKDGRDGFVGSLALGATRLFAKTPEEGASTQVYLAATTDDVAKGAFYEEMKEKADLPWFAVDGAKARALWDASEDLSRIRFDLTAVVATTDGAAAGGVEISAEDSFDISGDEGDAKTAKDSSL